MAWNTAVAMSTARLMPTARMPSRDRLIEGSISPCECPCSTEAVGFGILTDLSGGPAPDRSPRRAARKRFAARSDVVGPNSSPGDDQLTLQGLPEPPLVARACQPHRARAGAAARRGGGLPACGVGRFRGARGALGDGRRH